MANEPVKKTAVAPAADPGAKAGAGNPAPGAQAPVAAKPAVVASPVTVAASASQSVALFGGHRGGGKKRADGLVAGSKEAIEADRQADAKRKRDARAEKKIAALPPTLPGAPSPAQNQNPAAVASVAAQLAVDGNFVVTADSPFVPWTTRVLEKPAKLVGKILDRWRSYSRASQVKKLKLKAAAEKEILERMKWKEDVVNDFAVALADCSTQELNQHRIRGAEKSHWITLVMTAGELITLEMANMAMIEKLILDDRAKQAEEEKKKA